MLYGYGYNRDAYDRYCAYNKGENSLGIKSDSYNFILEQSDKFFDKFLDDSKLKHNGGILVISENNYVLSFNSGHGYGSHANALARAYKELNGGGEIKSVVEAISCSNYAQKNYITARIVYEKLDGRLNNEGYIDFSIPEDLEITQEMYEQFMNFYDKYNEEIKNCIMWVRKRKFVTPGSLLQANREHQEFCVLVNGMYVRDDLEAVKSQVEAQLVRNKTLSLTK